MKPALTTAVLLLTACVTKPQRMVVPAELLEDRVVRDVVREALQADAKGDPADSLYLVGATVVANGRVRVSLPRFAGIELGGNLQITGLQAEITSTLAWAIMDYQWVSADGSRGAFGRATVVLEPFGGAWRIKHVHSSTARP